MNWLTFAIGIFSLGFGLFTIYIRFKAPTKLAKLEPMQQMYGQRLGTAIHIFQYTIMPIAFGILMILGGIYGVSAFGR